MSIRNWHETDRPREKLLYRGAEHLSDSELLAIFLRTGTRGKSAVELARDLLNHYGNLRNLLDTSAENFCQQHGMGYCKQKEHSSGEKPLPTGRRRLGYAADHPEPSLQGEAT